MTELLSGGWSLLHPGIQLPVSFLFFSLQTLLALLVLVLYLGTGISGEYSETQEGRNQIQRVGWRSQEGSCKAPYTLPTPTSPLCRFQEAAGKYQDGSGTATMLRILWHPR